MKEEIYTFIGKDGCGYTSSQDLMGADKQWKRRNLQYMAKDGSFHPDMESVRRVNRSMLQYKANDGCFYDDMETVREINKDLAGRYEQKPIKLNLFDNLRLIEPKFSDSGLVGRLK